MFIDQMPFLLSNCYIQALGLELSPCSQESRALGRVTLNKQETTHGGFTGSSPHLLPDPTAGLPCVPE